MTVNFEKKIRSIEERLAILEKMVISDKKAKGSNVRLSISVDDLLALPNSLRTTVMAIQDINEGTSLDVAKKSGRTRSVETIYLNQLVRMGYLTRERRGRKVYFRPIKYY